jgi:enamine deaminase RidA (YjgF/YER057c/UK114 family)
MSPVSAMPNSIESLTPLRRLARLGLVLPPPPPPIANFLPSRLAGDLLFLSGQGPREADGQQHIGKVGREVSVTEAYGHARLVGLNLLAVMQAALGDLGRVRAIVKLFGMVNAIPDFSEHPLVINGCSDFFVAVFGEAGAHARSAIGVGSLPGQITVEIEAVVQVAPQ